jgi:aspartate carbamoyltransferase catalytic subunit
VKHLLSIADLDVDDLEQLMRLTDSFVEVSGRQIPKVPALRGKNACRSSRRPSGCRPTP